MRRKSAYPLKLPTSIKIAAAQLAKADGISLNQFIAAAVAEKVGNMRMVLNLKTARALGIKIPGSVRLRADEVIE